MADSTEVPGTRSTTAADVAWIAGYAAALEDVGNAGSTERPTSTVLGEWIAQPMQTARLAWRRRINGGAS
jgi:hypothetical protein